MLRVPSSTVTGRRQETFHIWCAELGMLPSLHLLTLGVMYPPLWGGTYLQKTFGNNISIWASGWEHISTQIVDHNHLLSFFLEYDDFQALALPGFTSVRVLAATKYNMPLFTCSICGEFSLSICKTPTLTSVHLHLIEQSFVISVKQSTLSKPGSCAEQLSPSR